MSCTLLRGRYVVTDPDRLPGGVVEHGAVVVGGGRVAAIGLYSELRARYPEARELGSERDLVVPGLVNAHHHGQGLTTTAFGVQDDYLEPWIADFWARVRPTDVYLDTLFAAMRLLRSGITSVLHIGYVRDPPSYEREAREALRAYEDAGLRVAFGLQARDRNSFVYGDDDAFIASLPQELGTRVRSMLRQSPGPSTEDYLALVSQLRREYEGHPRIEIIVCASGPQWCSDELLARLRETADAYETAFHLHCLESPFQREHGRRLYGVGTIEHLERLGVLGPRVSLAHAVWLTDREIDVCARTGTTICHNPSSNLRLRVGVLPAAELVARGVNVALGIDGMGLSEDDDMLEEMRVAAALHGLPQGLASAPSVTPSDAFRMATTNGARPTALDPGLGRLVVGCPADVAIVDLDRIAGPYLDPRVNVVDALVHRGRSLDVRTVLVDGEVLLEHGTLVKLDEHAIVRELGERASAAPAPRIARNMSVAADVQPYVAAFYRGWPEPSLAPYYRPNSAQ